MEDIKVKEELIEELERKIEELKQLSAKTSLDISDQIRKLEEEKERLINEIYSNLTPWEKVQLARHPKRPTTLDYVNNVFSDFTELKGDRFFRDDLAIVGGVAFFRDIPVMVIGHQKGRDVSERLMRNFGMPHPEGFKKAIRLMRLADRWGLPVVSFIDTPGAYPGVGAEERGQFIAIAESILTMSRLRVPTVVVVIGEGGSGGALGIGVGNYVLMLEHSYYSVISPEGCASIIYRDSKRAPEAARQLRLTAKDLIALGVVDEVIPEPLGGAHRDPQRAYQNLSEIIDKYLKAALQMSPEEILTQRYEKYRRMAVLIEGEKLVSSADLRALYNEELPEHLSQILEA